MYSYHCKKPWKALRNLGELMSTLSNTLEKQLRADGKLPVSLIGDQDAMAMDRLSEKES